MELCEYDLTQYVMLLSISGRLNTQALPICYQILSGLQALHDVAMLHMNLKVRLHQVYISFILMSLPGPSIQKFSQKQTI
jgi:hypothetical protein